MIDTAAVVAAIEAAGLRCTADPDTSAMWLADGAETWPDGPPGDGTAPATLDDMHVAYSTITETPGIIAQQRALAGCVGIGTRTWRCQIVADTAAEVRALAATVAALDNTLIAGWRVEVAPVGPIIEDTTARYYRWTATLDFTALTG
jgi:hypothetical protein